MNVKIFDFSSPEITSQSAQVTALHKRSLSWREDEKWTLDHFEHLRAVIDAERSLDSLCRSARVSFWTHWGDSKEGTLDVSLDNRSRG